MYHSYTALQNLGMVLYWYFNMESHPWYTNALIGLVVGSSLLGAFISLVYYRYHTILFIFIPTICTDSLQPIIESVYWRLRAVHDICT